MLSCLFCTSLSAEPGQSNAKNDKYNYWKDTITNVWQQTGKYKGIWWSSGLKAYEGGIHHKISGPGSTATNKHAPLAVTKGNFTYFIINGQSEYYPYYKGQEGNRGQEVEQSPIAYMVGKYDHVNDVLYPPTTIHVKGTTDAHDNAALNVDDQGFVYVFISGRNEKRGGLIYKSNKANSIESFSMVYSKKYPIEWLDYDCDPNYTSNGWELCRNEYRGFTYPQVWWVGDKFLLLHTIYLPLTYEDKDANPTYMRALYISKVTPTAEGVSVSTPKKLVAVKGDYTKGHYSVSVEKNGTIGLAFNVHIKDNSEFQGTRLQPHDNRTNLYFMYTKNGDDWFDIDGKSVALGSSYQGLTRPEQLSQVAVREYHDPVSGKTNETEWCDDRYRALGKAEPEKYVCRRIYVKAIDMEVDGHGKPSRVEILYSANRSIENPNGTEYGPFPSSKIDSTDINLARYFYTESSKKWDTERILLDGKDIIDNVYTSGTLFLNNGVTTVITPASFIRDGKSGQEQVYVFKNSTGAKGAWESSANMAKMYEHSLENTGRTANHVVSVHNAKGNFKVLWSEGTNDLQYEELPAQGTEAARRVEISSVQLLLGNEKGQSAKLPSDQNVPTDGLSLKGHFPLIE